jgi:hypothetical protein
MAVLKAGDIVVVTKLDWFGRSTRELLDHRPHNEARVRQSASPFNLSDTNFAIGLHPAEHTRLTAEAPAPHPKTGASFLVASPCYNPPKSLV